MKKLVISALILSLLLNLFLAYAARDSIRMKIASFFHSETSFSDVKEDSSKILAKTRNKPIVTHSAFGNVDFLEIDSLSSESNQLPDSLFISAGKYKCYENTYNLKAAGVYRFIYPGIGNEQRIVHNGDIDTLLSSIAWVVTHGNSDTSLNNKLLLQKATQSKIFTTCGKVSRLANSILDKFEIKSRIVSGVTTDEWNSYSNGHTLLEVYREKHQKWVLYDLDKNCFFTRNNKPLSFIELSKIIGLRQDYRIEKLSSDIQVDVSSFLGENNYEYAFLSESSYASDKTLKQWYSRCLKVPLIKSGTFYYFHENDSISERVSAYSSKYKRVTTCKEFINRFYSENYNTTDFYLGICNEN